MGNKGSICYQLLQVYFGANENRTWCGYNDVNLQKKEYENTGNNISLTNPILHLYGSIHFNGISHDLHWSKHGENQAPFIFVMSFLI